MCAVDVFLAILRSRPTPHKKRLILFIDFRYCIPNHYYFPEEAYLRLDNLLPRPLFYNTYLLDTGPWPDQFSTPLLRLASRTRLVASQPSRLQLTARSSDTVSVSYTTVASHRRISNLFLLKLLLSLLFFSDLAYISWDCSIFCFFFFLSFFLQAKSHSSVHVRARRPARSGHPLFSACCCCCCCSRPPPMIPTGLLPCPLFYEARSQLTHIVHYTTLHYIYIT